MTCYLFLLVFSVLFAIPAYGRGERETVAVLAARVRWGLSQRLEMPDEPPRVILKNVRSTENEANTGVQAELESATNPSTPPVEGERIETLIRTKVSQPLPPETVSEPLESRVEETPLPLVSTTVDNPRGDPSRSLTFATAEPVPPLLTLIQPVRGPVVMPESVYSATMFTGEDVHGKGWCQNCPAAKARFGAGNERIKIEYSGAVAPGFQIYPAWRWKDARGVWRQPADESGNYAPPANLDALLKLVESTGPQQPDLVAPSVAASAVGGSLRTRGKIRVILDFWKQHIGPDSEVTIRWDRTGLQSLSATKLMAGQPWTPLMVAGKFGHVDLSTTSTRMPGALQELGFTYKTLDNGRFSVDLDAIAVSLPSQPNKGTYGTNGKYEAVGVVDPISIGFYVYSFATALYQILNPQVDVGLGGCVAMTAKLEGPDKLTATFSECPSIHVAVWFKFDLDVQRVVVTPTNVHIDFKPQPQNWIRIDSRDFAVDDGS